MWKTNISMQNLFLSFGCLIPSFKVGLRETVEWVKEAGLEKKSLESRIVKCVQKGKVWAYFFTSHLLFLSASQGVDANGL